MLALMIVVSILFLAFVMVYKNKEEYLSPEENDAIIKSLGEPDVSKRN